MEVMQRGATDYIIKDRLGRLGQAVAQGLEKKRMRHQTRLAESSSLYSQNLQGAVNGLQALGVGWWNRYGHKSKRDN